MLSLACALFLSQCQGGEFSLIGRAVAQRYDSSAVPTHTWLTALQSAESRDAPIAYWGSFVSRDLPLYATSPRPQNVKYLKYVRIAQTCQTGFEDPKNSKGATAAIGELHQMLDLCDDLLGLLRLEIIRIGTCT